MQMTSNPTVEKNPEYSCYYYNENDPRVCVCGRDKAQCGKRGCVPNLATTGGKIIQFLLSAAIIAMVVFMIIQQGGKAKKNESVQLVAAPSRAWQPLRKSKWRNSLFATSLREDEVLLQSTLNNIRYLIQEDATTKCTKAKVF